ncbi:FG-GAP repeat domain-containing protein [Candidatus Hydrogenedentota bacterium]
MAVATCLEEYIALHGCPYPRIGGNIADCQLNCAFLTEVSAENFVSHPRNRTLKKLMAGFALWTLIIPPYQALATISARNTIASDIGSAWSICAADIDSDGHLDVFSAARESDQAIMWWENWKDDATDWRGTVVAASFDGAESVYAADMDGDGDMDVVGAASLANEVAWWENINSGFIPEWPKHQVDTNFGGALWAYAADIDNDGDLDILGAASVRIDGWEIAWWENTNTDGDGTAWTKHSVRTDFCGAHSVQAADIDGDGDLDIIGAARCGNAIVWWENTDEGEPSWSEYAIDQEFVGAMCVYATDVDNDGDIDVVGTANGTSSINFEGAVAWWENTSGDGVTWVKHSVDEDFFGGWYVYSGDMDNDGDADILGAARDGDEIAWWENTKGDGTEWVDHTLDADFGSPRCVRTGDLDGDGDLDILGAAEDAKEIAWWRNDMIHRSSTFPTKVDVEGNYRWASSVHGGDVDGDGDLDVLAAALDSFDVCWWENADSIGKTWTKHIVDDISGKSSSTYGADIDADGDLDILVTGAEGNYVRLWKNATGEGAEWTRHDIDADFEYAHSVYSCDVDGDGNLDVLGAARDGDEIAWWENADGGGVTWIKHSVEQDFDGASSVYGADLDGDGDVDILGAGSNAGKITWWENTTGDGTEWISRNLDATVNGAASVYAADVNGDGLLDVLGAAQDDNEISWWENPGEKDSSWTRSDVVREFSEAIAVFATDVDRDGDVDVLGAAFGDDEVAWWENKDGDGRNWEKHIVDENFKGARAVYAADICGDGDIDLLGAAFSDNQIAVWENLGYCGERLPVPDVYVATDGDDNTGDGTVDKPWQTISQAIYLVEGTAENPVTINVSAGTYGEQVEMDEYESIAGADAFTTILQWFSEETDLYVIKSASNVYVSGLTITTPEPETRNIQIMKVDEVSLSVHDVVFDGKNNPQAYGMFVRGTGSNDTLAYDCTFEKIGYGVQAVNTSATFTGNTFEEIREDAIFIRPPPSTLVESAGEVPLFGDFSDLTTGGNTFKNVQGFYVYNQSSTKMKAEINDWELYTEAEIDAKMSDTVDFVPFLGKTGPFIITYGDGRVDQQQDCEGDLHGLCLLTLEAIPNCGWTFDHWDIDSLSDDEYGDGDTVVVPDKLNAGITAVFTERPEEECPQPPCPPSSAITGTLSAGYLLGIRSTRDDLLDTVAGSAMSQLYYRRRI